MKKMHVYDVYVEDYDGVCKYTVPATSKQAAKKTAGLPSGIVAVKDADLQDIDIDCLINALRRAGWGEEEISVIALTLVACGLERQKEAEA